MGVLNIWRLLPNANQLTQPRNSIRSTNKPAKYLIRISANSIIVIKYPLAQIAFVANALGNHVSGGAFLRCGIINSISLRVNRTIDNTRRDIYVRDHNQIHTLMRASTNLHDFESGSTTRTNVKHRSRKRACPAIRNGAC